MVRDADGNTTGQANVKLAPAHLQREHLNDLVQPYALRAPEVVLGLEWGPAIDMWSLGCLVYHFFVYFLMT
jgi:serine/threonine protein kinase